MKRMPIVWQRLVSRGQTCARCANTHRELEAAVEKLAAALRPLGIEPVLEMREIAEDAFAAAPLESNRVWIAGRPIEAWLGARVGASRCCSVCGEADCRTLEVGERTFETIPQALIVKAGLIAAGESIAAEASQDPGARSCCDERRASAPSGAERAQSGCCA